MSDLQIPKGFLTGIRITGGPFEGELAQPCMCGWPMDNDEPVYLIQWNDGRLMVCHASCVRDDEDDA